MTQNVAETVTFALADSVSDAEFVTLSKLTEAFVRSCPGFIFRRLSKGEDGRWTDAVVWQDMATAQAAAKAFEAQNFLPALMGAMKPDSVTMRHETIHWTMAA